MSIKFVKDIVEDNKKTIFENNMDRKHNIPIDTLVEVKYNRWHGDGCCEKVHARLWVVDHIRDCDGTPLYCLSTWKSEAVLSIQRNFGKLAVHLQGGFSEESLKPVKVTPELANGVGSLKWDKEDK